MPGDPRVPSLSDALVTWTGWGRNPFPARDEGKLAEQFGADVAQGLLPRLRELEDDFYSSDARYAADDLAEMADRAA